MSLCPQSLPPVPDDTARIARAAFRRGNPYVLLRDRLGAVFADADFADLYPKRGQPAYTPWRLALVTLMQFREGLSDRQAAEAVRGRIDWKYLLALDLTDDGFDFSVLCEFRARLLQHGATERLLARLLDAARESGLLKTRGRQRTDSTHVLAAVRDLNRLELLGETLRAALNAIAVAAPDWLRAVAPAEWHDRYDRRVEDMRLPDTRPKRDAYAVQVGTDGFLLLDALDGAGAPASVRDLPEVGVLRRVWARHFERDEAGPGGSGNAGEQVSRSVRLRAAQGRGPGDRVESPYDTEARFRSKAGTNWTGYMVHVTETCDADTPHLIVHTDATPANVHEAMRTEPIHDALAAKKLTPSEHLADAAYVSAAHLVAARERHGIDLVGPPRPDQSWQKQQEGAFRSTDFTIDWECQRVRCPEGHESTTWGDYKDRASGQSYIRAGFSPAVCRPCPSRSRCTRAASRRLGLLPRPEHEAIAAARARLETGAGRRLYSQRQGIEGTISQGVRAFGLRRARYRGLAKVSLQGVATAAAINLDRLGAWFAKRPLATHPHLALRRARGLAREFANGIRTFSLCFDLNRANRGKHPRSAGCHPRCARVWPGPSPWSDLTGRDDVPPGDCVEISVADAGTGMTPDVLARAFEPFFTTKPLGQGTGLGLSQLHGFVRQSGGALWLSSQPGQGTAVRLCLPRHAAAGVGSSEAAGTTGTSSRTEFPYAGATGRRVLVVKDEEGVRALLVEVLRDLGCVVLEAADGSAARRALQPDGQVGLLVTDVGLPGLNGRQFADAARKSRPSLPALLITGYAGTALEGGQLARGLEVMTKPFTVGALAARVQALLERAHS